MILLTRFVPADKLPELLNEAGPAFVKIKVDAVPSAVETAVVP